MDPNTSPSAKPEQTLDDSARPLVEVGAQEWTPDDLKTIDGRYKEILTEIFDSANLSVTQYQKLSNSNRIWRRRLIVGTGLVAIVNLLAAHKIPQEFPRLSNLNWAAPIAAAVLAA